MSHWALWVSNFTAVKELKMVRTIVKPLWQLPPSEAKKPSNISRTKNVALKLPKICLTKGYFGQFKGYILGLFKGYIFAVLGHFCFLLRLGGCGSQGLDNRSKKMGIAGCPQNRAFADRGCGPSGEALPPPPLLGWLASSGPKCTVSRRWFAVKVCDSFTRSNCTQRLFLGNRLRFLCGNDTVAVAMHFAMKNAQICFLLRKFLAISPAIQRIASDCGCDAVVHLAQDLSSEKVCVSQERVSGFPEKGADLRGSPRRAQRLKKIKICELSFPLQRKSPKNGEKLPKKYSENTFFCNFSVIFPRFRGLDWGGEFCNFFPFFGISAPGASGALWGEKQLANQDRPPGLKFSIEIEKFKRATQQTPIFCGEF